MLGDTISPGRPGRQKRRLKPTFTSALVLAAVRKVVAAAQVLLEAGLITSALPIAFAAPIDVAAIGASVVARRAGPLLATGEVARQSKRTAQQPRDHQPPRRAVGQAQHQKPGLEQSCWGRSATLVLSSLALFMGYGVGVG